MTSKGCAVDPIDVIRWVALACFILSFALDIAANNLENEAEPDDIEAQVDDFHRGYREGLRDATILQNDVFIDDAVPVEKD